MIFSQLTAFLQIFLVIFPPVVSLPILVIILLIGIPPLIRNIRNKEPIKNRGLFYFVIGILVILFALTCLIIYRINRWLG